jgi:hypothetical protein
MERSTVTSTISKGDSTVPEKSTLRSSDWSRLPSPCPPVHARPSKRRSLSSKSGSGSSSKGRNRSASHSGLRMESLSSIFLNFTEPPRSS